MPFFPGTIGLLERGLEAAQLRHATLAQNLANVNTPGYKAVRVRFEDLLQQSLDRQAPAGGGMTLLATHPRHLGAAAPAPTDVRPLLVRDPSHALRADGNNVDLEAEAARVAANQIWYQALAQQVNAELNRLRLAITEGRR